jgi:hypothetical protein
MKMAEPNAITIEIKLSDLTIITAAAIAWVAYTGSHERDLSEVISFLDRDSREHLLQAIQTVSSTIEVATNRLATGIDGGAPTVSRTKRR